MRKDDSKQNVRLAFVSPVHICISLLWRSFLCLQVLSRKYWVCSVWKAFKFSLVRLCYGFVYKERERKRGVCAWVIHTHNWKLTKNYAFFYNCFIYFVQLFLQFLLGVHVLMYVTTEYLCRFIFAESLYHFTHC